jgi:RNA polymerase sigma-70 factor (ECF subfamily)
LSDLNTDKLFVKLLARNERHIRSFVRSTGMDWNATEEISQSVALIMWKKWKQFEVGSDFMKWARSIARFEILKYRRGVSRDRLVFNEELIELLANSSEAMEAELSSQDYIESLQLCIDRLPEKSKKIIEVVYQSEKTIKQIAEEIGKSPTSLYKTVDRIRKKLKSCLERRLSAM